MLPKGNRIVACYSLIVLIVSYFTFVHGFEKPAALFWDENYHIPAAEKYLNKVFFMEYHPPLGKMLIALGEYILHPNEGKDITPMLSKSYIKEVPAGFSFKGMRLFPTLFSWLGAVVFFLLLNAITSNPHTALLFSSLYVFENSIIVHFRGAMLDGIQMFFILLALYYFVRLLREEKPLSNIKFLWFGLFVGLGLAVKITALVITVLFPFLIISKIKNEDELRQLRFYKKIFLNGVSFTLGIAVPFFSIWYLHFTLGQKIVEDQLYGASFQLTNIVYEQQQARPENFFLQLRDTYKFFLKNNRGVPKLDLCKPGENGSYPLSWILGGKSINYRWEKANNQKVKYLYLQNNPMILMLSFIGIGLSLVLVLARVFFAHPIHKKELYFFILVFTTFYAVYMGLMLRLERVMYFYHYFIPYITSFILVYLLFNYAFDELVRKKNRILLSALALLFLEVLLVFLYYSPLTYYQPISAKEVNNRAWIKTWQLKPVI